VIGSYFYDGNTEYQISKYSVRRVREAGVIQNFREVCLRYPCTEVPGVGGARRRGCLGWGMLGVGHALYLRYGVLGVGGVRGIFP